MNRTKQLILLACAVELGTGVVAALSPSLLVWLLWAIPLTVGGELAGRLAGFALVSLAVACWPSPAQSDTAALRALLLYNGLGALLFLTLAVRTPFHGIVFWPALLFHVLMSALLLIAWWPRREKFGSRPLIEKFTGKRT
jgi:hypothetical protein